MFGNELDVIVDEHEIKLEMISPDSEEAELRAWDDQMFYQGNMHLEGVANPIKPESPQNETFGDDEEEPEWIYSEKYKDYMENKLIEDIVYEGKESSRITLTTATLAILTTQTFFTAFLYFVI